MASRCSVELGRWRGRRYGAVSNHFLEGLRIDAVREVGWWWGASDGEIRWWVDVWWEVSEAFGWGVVDARVVAVRSRHS